MDVADLFETEGEGIAVLSLHVQPGAGPSAVVGRHGEALKVRVGAAPEGGRANQACARLVADTFGLEPAQVEMVSGETNRQKRFRVSGIDPEEFRQQLEKLVGGDGRRGRIGGRGGPPLRP